MTTNEMLWQRFEKGEIAAFNMLYERHMPSLLRYATRMVRRPQIAAEIIQEVWLTLIQKSDNPHLQKAFAPILYTATRNKIIDFTRSAKNKAWEEIDTLTLASKADDLINTHPTSNSDLSTLLQNKQCLQHLLSCVEALPIHQKEAFVLQYESGLSLAEIARVTESNVETIKSRLRYAKNNIREAMKEWL